MSKKLYKSNSDTKIDGVCAGIAEYLGIDSTLVRVIWLFFILAAGTGLLAYIICCIIMPRRPRGDDYNRRDEKNYDDRSNDNTYR